MADVPAPSYPNYANFLSNLIGGLPTDYRNAQEQQTRIDVNNSLKGGVPTNPDGTINYAAAMNKFAQAGDPQDAVTLAQLAQTQQWQQQGQAPPALLGGGGAPPAPSAAPPAPMQPPPAAPPQAPSGAIAGAVSDDAGPPPTLAALVSGVAPDPTKVAPTTAFLAKVLNVDPNAPLTPDQVARAQRVMANLAKPSVAGPAMGGTAPQPSGFAGRLDVPPDPAVAGARAVAAPPVGIPQPAAARDITAEETASYGSPRRLLTQAEAVAIATGNAPGTGGAAGTPFGLPPIAEAVWQRMVPQESGGKQFNADGSVVTSPKGAMGVAQVMPETGPEAARLAGLPWDPVRFKNDPNYNLALGRAYYAQQVKAFGSPDVAAAAYNAGPRAVLAAQAKAISRGGSYLDYLPAETKDYVAKVTTGAAPQQAAGGGARQQGGRPIYPEPSLPEPFKPGQEPQAIDWLRKTALHYAQIPGNNGAASANYYNRQADAIEAWMQPKEFGPGRTLLDPYGKPIYQTPMTNVKALATQRFLEEHPDATAAQLQAFERSGQAPRSAAGMALQRFLEENPNADADEIQAFNAQAAGQSLMAKRTVSFESAENEAKALIPAVRTAAQAVTSTNYPDVNKIIQAGLMHSGDPNVVKLGVAMESLSQAYARALSPTGSPLASDKEHAHAILQQYWSVGQINAALDQMEAEIARAKQSLNTTRKELGAGALKEDGAAPAPAQSAPGGGAGGQPVKVTTEEEYNALPKGATYIHPDGTTRTKQ